MPTPRTEVAAAVLAGKIYVIGGFDGLGRTVATVEV
jgi:Kelch motif